MKTILVIEDNEQNLYLMQTMLKGHRKPHQVYFMI